MPFADLGDFTMFYTDEGAGPPVVLIHGYTCDGSDWSWQTPALKDKHRVITVDLRGHGHSTAPEGGYTIPQFAEDVASLLKRLETGPAVVMGHSMGGAVAAQMAATHPELVRATVSVDSALGMDPASRGMLEETLKAVKTPAGHDVVAGFFGSAFYPPASPPHLAALHARRLRALPHHVLAGALAALAVDETQVSLRPESEALLAKVKTPLLTFRAGNEDPSAVAAWERAQSTNPYSKAVAWEGTGHFLHQERPAEFNAIVEAWIAGLP